MKKFFSTLFALLILGAGGSAFASSVTVTTNLDEFGGSNDCSLRDAIESANTNSEFGGCTRSDGSTIDTILFQNPDDTYNLTIDPGLKLNPNAEGDLAICVSLTLQGGGPDQTIIRANFSANTPDRVVQIRNGGCVPPPPITFGSDDLSGQGPLNSVVIDGVTITNGDASLVDTGVKAGGGIANEAGLTLMNSVVEFNRGDNLGPNESNFDVYGAGIANLGGLGVVDSDVRNNDITMDANGTGEGFGGGIATARGVGSSGLTGQGAQCLMAMVTSNVNGNTVTNFGQGGGIYNDNCLLVITMSAVFDNHVLGAFMGDRQGSAGGLFNDMCCTSNVLGISDSTFSGNTAVNNAGGLYDNSQEGVAAIGSSTFANNAAANNGGGWYREAFTSDQAFTFQNTIVADNTATNGPDCWSDPVQMDPYNSFDYNLVRDTTDCVIIGMTANNKPAGSDPNLAPLMNNGGRTPTHALILGSEAIDMGNNVEGCTEVPNSPTLIEWDQRDDPFARTVAGVVGGTPRCDIGAYEFVPTAITTEKTVSDAIVQVGDSFTYTITITNNGPGQATNVQINDPLPALVTFVSFGNISQGTCNQAAGVITCDIGVLAVNAVATVEVNVQAVAEGTATNTATVTTNETEPQNPSATNEIVEGFCVTGSGPIWNTIRPACANCSLNPHAFSLGFWRDYGPYLILGFVLAVGLVLRRRRSQS